MTQQGRQLLGRSILHAGREQLLSSGHLGIGGHLGEDGFVDSAFIALGPALVPVGEEDGSVGPQVDIRNQGVPDQRVVRHQLVSCSGGPQLQRTNPAFGTGAFEVGQ